MKKILYSILIVTVFVVSVLGQSATPRLQGELNTIGGINLQTWSAGPDRITQFALPITFIYPINPRARIDFITSPAFSSLNSGDSHSLNGLSDIRIRGHYLTKDEHWLFTYGLVLPTGKNALTTEEFNVSNAMSIHALNFQAPFLGQGRDVNLGVASAFEYNDFIIGYGFSYLHKDNYKPFKGSEYDYDPGNEFNLTAGLEKNVYWLNRDMRVTADLVYTMYGSDTGNNEKVFKSGNRLILQGTAFVPMDNYDLLLFIRDKLKGKNKTGTGDFFDVENKNSNGNEFQILARALLPPRNGQRYSGMVDFKWYANNGYDKSGALVFGLGGGYQRPLKNNMVFNGGLGFYFGSINSSGKNVGVTGIKLNGNIRYFFN